MLMKYNRQMHILKHIGLRYRYLLGVEAMLEINEDMAKKIGLNRKSVIKTTKIYTGSRMKLGSKIGDLPIELRNEFKNKYEEYQKSIISKW